MLMEKLLVNNNNYFSNISHYYIIINYYITKMTGLQSVTRVRKSEIVMNLLFLRKGTCIGANEFGAALASLSAVKEHVGMTGMLLSN